MEPVVSHSSDNTLTLAAMADVSTRVPVLGSTEDNEMYIL